MGRGDWKKTDDMLHRQQKSHEQSWPEEIIPQNVPEESNHSSDDEEGDLHDDVGEQEEIADMSSLDDLHEKLLHIDIKIEYSPSNG